jgi:4-amino-4-deoxy-L-arabinose transferase-like glycosyltransferase
MGTTSPIPRWLIAAALLLSFAGLFFHDLWTPDEPREAALVLEMSRGGDWIIPHLAGEPFVEKPPLYYEICALWLRLDSLMEPRAGWLRLTSALFGLGTLLMTWLLARQLLGRDRARPAVLVLATLPGFVHVSHWLLTDGALMFFVSAALAALAGAYVGRRPLLLPIAGALAAAAFLTKGLIGPLFIALGGLPLLLLSKPWKKVPPVFPNLGNGGAEPTEAMHGLDDQPEATAHPQALRLHQLAVLFWHLTALLSFVLPIAAWATALWRYGGRALFMEWFWTNHFGRFSGAATQLGHMNGPLFYLGALPLYLLPWLPVIAWLCWRALRHRDLSRLLLAPLVWGLGGVLLLSLSATKREIYLAPLLPAFALLAAHAISQPLPRLLAWSAGRRYAIGLVAVYLLGLLVAEPIVNRHKSYGPAFREFDRKLVARSGVRAAGWQLDETTLAGFYWYSDREVTVLTNRAEVTAVLTGQHLLYNAIIALHKRGEVLPADFAAKQETAVRMGPRRTLLLLSGNRDTFDPNQILPPRKPKP